MTDQEWELIEKKKQSALEVLGPLGFVDNDDGELPGSIYHSATGVVIDTARVKAADVIRFVFNEGRERGTEDARAAMRKALGL